MGFFWENSQKTCDLFSQKTAGKHVTILPSKTMANCLCVFQENRQRKRQSVSLGNSWDKDKFFLFVSLENNQGNRLPFWDSNRWNNFILFSLCLRGKRFKRFPGKHKLYMFSKAVFLENGDHPQQCKGKQVDLQNWKCSSMYQRRIFTSDKGYTANSRGLTIAAGSSRWWEKEKIILVHGPGRLFFVIT